MKSLENIQTRVMDYPILKHFDQGEIVLNPNGQTQLKPIGKTIFGVATLGVVGGLGYLIWVYVLPPIMIMLGQFLALAITAIAATFLFIMFPTFIKAMKMFAIASQKAIIREDPFGELEIQKNKMIQNEIKFKESKAKIKSLKNTMEMEANKSERDSVNYQNQIVTLSNESKKIKEKMDSLVAKHGPTVKDTDEYTDLENSLTIKLSTAQRVSHQMEQSKMFVQKYGARVNTMARLDRNLSKASTAISIKIADFDTTVAMLKKDFEFARNSKNATDAAKDVLGFTEEWEMTYALDVVTSTISMDIARTSENILDIETLTSKYSIDNDELFNNLDKLATKISGGNEVVPSASKYSNPNYKLTTEDKQASGGFGNIF